MCLTDVELTFLTKDDVQLVAVDYPFLMERINALAAKRLARDGIKMNTILDETAKSLGVDPNGQQVRLTALPGPGGRVPHRGVGRAARGGAARAG